MKQSLKLTLVEFIKNKKRIFTMNHELYMNKMKNYLMVKQKQNSPDFVRHLKILISQHDAVSLQKPPIVNLKMQCESIKYNENF